MEKKALNYLACEGESMKECLSELAPLKGRLILRYHKGSEKMGRAHGIDCRLWDVLSPKIPGYRYDSESHIPTLSILGMQERGLLK